MFSGFAILLAWPQTKCKQAGAWYDPLMTLSGFNKNGYYTVGHAAIVLVDKSSQTCHYFDFGRYHTPHGHGRVRGANTDHDLTIHTKAIFDDDKKSIANINVILQELYVNPSTHGDGTVFCAELKVDFKKSLNFVYKLQEQDFFKYGPFVLNGSNCSRFVNKVARKGSISMYKKLKLALPFTVTATPYGNLKAVTKKILSYNADNNEQNELKTINQSKIKAA